MLVSARKTTEARFHSGLPQIWSAVCIYVLLAIVKKRLGIKASLYEMLQILRNSRTPKWQPEPNGCFVANGTMLASVDEVHTETKLGVTPEVSAAAHNETAATVSADHQLHPFNGRSGRGRKEE
jgi:hypothetical protein